MPLFDTSSFSELLFGLLYTNSSSEKEKLKKNIKKNIKKLEYNKKYVTYKYKLWKQLINSSMKNIKN